jgi:hypothetical protein
VGGSTGFGIVVARYLACALLGATAMTLIASAPTVESRGVPHVTITTSHR